MLAAARDAAFMLDSASAVRIFFLLSAHRSSTSLGACAAHFKKEIWPLMFFH